MPSASSSDNRRAPYFGKYSHTLLLIASVTPPVSVVGFRFSLVAFRDSTWASRRRMRWWAARRSIDLLNNLHCSVRESILCICALLFISSSKGIELVAFDATFLSFLLQKWSHPLLVVWLSFLLFKEVKLVAVGCVFVTKVRLYTQPAVALVDCRRATYVELCTCICSSHDSIYCLLYPFYPTNHNCYRRMRWDISHGGRRQSQNRSSQQWSPECTLSFLVGIEQLRLVDA